MLAVTCDAAPLLVVDIDIICLLLGSTRQFSDQRLRALDRDAATYLDAYERATDDAIAAGFVVPEDRQAMLDDASPDVIPQ